VKSTAVAPDWSSIDTVLLDMDGTLLDLGFDIQFWQEWVPRHYAESRRLPIDQARLVMKPIFEATHGTLDWYCIDYWSRALSLDTAARAHGIEWLYAIRRPDSRAPSRAVKDFPGVDSVHELAQGLAPRIAESQPAGGA
jgi:FMN phosphatase YigB (HAD superfamily)